MEVVNNEAPRRGTATTTTASTTSSSNSAPHYQLTELKSVAATGRGESSYRKRQPSQTVVSECFVGEGEGDIARSVVEAVHSNPCLYDPNHEHNGSKPQSVQYRSIVWADLARELGFENGSASALQSYWIRLKTRYHEIRNRHIASGVSPDRSLDQDSLNVYRRLHFLDEFEREELSGLGNEDVYWAGEQEGTRSNVMLSGGYRPSRGSEYRQRQGAPAARPEPAEKKVCVVDVDDVDDCPSPSSEISVGSNGPQHKDQALVHSTAHGIQVQSGESPQQVWMKDVKVIDQGTVQREREPQMVSQIKKTDNGYVLVDSGPYYQGGNQKVYRLVNVNMDPHMNSQEVTLSSLQDEHGQPRRKRIALVPSNQLHSMQNVQSVQVSSPSAMPNSSRGRLGDDIILDDGIQEGNTIVIDTPYGGPDGSIEIENTDSPLPILADSPTSMLIGGHQQMVSGGGGTNHSMRQARSPSHNHMQHGQPDVTEVYSQYDADVAFQALIASHLNRLNDEEKTLMKFNIQRILLDARYGTGTCARIVQEEEDNEPSPGNGQVGNQH